MNRLQQLENWIEQLVEEPFVRLFAGQLLPQEVATRLVRALEDAEHIGADGQPEVPGCFCIALHPEDLAALQKSHPYLEAELAEALTSLIRHIDIRVRQAPTVRLEADATLQAHTIRIATKPLNAIAQGHTRDLDLSRLEAHEQQKNYCRAYLIVQGQHSFDLEQPIIHIGRALDNDLIIEDRRVSRYHAQIRQRYNRYLLQDLGSRGGTNVNGFPVQEIALRPGDVIALAGVELIFAEMERETDKSDTKPMDEATEERTRALPTEQ